MLEHQRNRRLHAVELPNILDQSSEIAPDAGIFELDFNIRYTDGPASSVCPDTVHHIFPTWQQAPLAFIQQILRFNTVTAASSDDYCILQGDILTVEYTDPTDAAGDPNTVTDSATFDLRNGVLQSDKSVYIIIGGDMILTIIEPDWDLDNDAAETYDLDIIEWDSDAATLSMGNLGGDCKQRADYHLIQNQQTLEKQVTLLESSRLSSKSLKN